MVIFKVAITIRYVIIVGGVTMLIRRSFSFRGLFRLDRYPSISIVLPYVGAILFQRDVCTLSGPLVTTSVEA